MDTWYLVGFVIVKYC